SHGSGGDRQSIAILDYGHTLLFHLSGHSVAGSISGWTDGQWHYVAATYNGSTAALYVDGQLLNSTTFSDGLVAQTEALIIGAFQDGNGYRTSGFGGSMDEVRVSKTALAGTAISDHWNANPQWSRTSISNLKAPAGGAVAITVSGRASNNDKTFTVTP